MLDEREEKGAKTGFCAVFARFIYLEGSIFRLGNSRCVVEWHGTDTSARVGSFNSIWAGSVVHHILGYRFEHNLACTQLSECLSIFRMDYLPPLLSNVYTVISMLYYRLAEGVHWRQHSSVKTSFRVTVTLALIPGTNP